MQGESDEEDSDGEGEDEEVSQDVGPVEDRPAPRHGLRIFLKHKNSILPLFVNFCTY